MRSLEMPLRNEHEDLRSCLERRSRSLLVPESLERELHDAYSKYEEVAFEQESVKLLSEGAGEALQGLFRLLDSGRPMVGMRRSLLSIESSDRCPLCDRLAVSELDHYLPRSAFPHYSVLGRNLVPICFRCNHIKRNKQRASRRLRFFHPYYDQVPSLPLIKVDVDVFSVAVHTVFYR